MSLEARLEEIRGHVEDAFDDYCDELKDREKDNLHEWVGNERKSVLTKETGRLSATVGIDEGKLLAIQWNANKVNYAKFDIGGHKSVMVPFTKKVPNSKESNGLWWHRFGATSGYAPISDAFKSMPKMSHFYRGI
ncbi:MAG: hypothetical protein ACK5LJ_08115 [Paracoccus sp. (in: a-proteobacteria)]